MPGQLFIFINTADLKSEEPNGRFGVFDDDDVTPAS